MNQVQRKRARRFAQFLLKVPTEQFDIDYVCYTTKDDRRPIRGLVGKCGSVACAIGHLPIFNPRVFVYKQWVERESSSEYDVRNVLTNTVGIRQHGTEYFGFTDKEAYWLFYPEGYNYQGGRYAQDGSG